MEDNFSAKPKKSLGQNFLKDRSVVERIVVAANLNPDDVVLEVGPGQGVLSEELVRYVRKVVAVELDENLVEGLKKKFQENETIEIIHGDIMGINLPDLMSPYQWDSGYKVVANIPYYITAKIIRLFLESDNPPTEMILMVQREVAERIAAGPGEMSLLSVSVQYYADPEILLEVGRECFDPVPNVDSEVIRIKLREDKTVHDREKNKKFFSIVRAGFAARRKMLANNLSNSLHLPKEEVEQKLISAGVSQFARAQELSIEDWRKLVELF